MWAVSRPLNQCGTAGAVNYSAGCMRRRRRCGLSRAQSGRSNRKRSGVPRTAQYQRERADHARGRHEQRDRAEVGDDAGLEQRDAGRGHRQEEGEIDDDRSSAAIAQRPEQVASRPSAPRPRPPRRRRQSRARARRTAGRHSPPNTSAPLSDAPERRARRAPPAGARCTPAAKAKMCGREDVAGVEVDEAAARTRRSRSSRCGCGAISSAAPTSQIASHGRPRVSFTTTKKIGSR